MTFLLNVFIIICYVIARNKIQRERNIQNFSIIILIEKLILKFINKLNNNKIIFRNGKLIFDMQNIFVLILKNHKIKKI